MAQRNKTRLERWHFIIYLFAVLIFPVVLPADPIFRVDHINPRNTPFWNDMADLMVAAAQDLNIQLEIHTADRHNSLQVVEKIIKLKNKPEYLIYMYHYDGTGKKILQKAETAKINSIIINTDIAEKDRAFVGNCREKLAHWIGHILPDDEKAGYDLAQTLFESARKAGKRSTDGKIHVVGLSGSYDSTAAFYRNQGLNKAVSENPDVVLHQIFWTMWKTEKAQNMIKGIFYRYPETSVIWTVFDGAALAAIKGLEEIGKKPGQDVFTGGIDWSADGIKAVHDGTMVATYGGHFIDGALSLIIAYDYHFGNDFAKGYHETVIKTVMQKIDRSNVEKYMKLFGERNWSKINFKKFTLTHNPGLSKYELKPETLFRSCLSK